MQRLPGRPAQCERRASALQGERTGQGVGIVPASWDFDERLTVAEIQRRGGARLGFVGNGSCRTEGAGKARGFLFIGRRSNLGVRARVRNHGEIPGPELRCVRETELPCGSGLLA